MFYIYLKFLFIPITSFFDAKVQRDSAINLRNEKFFVFSEKKSMDRFLMALPISIKNLSQ